MLTTMQESCTFDVEVGKEDVENFSRLSGDWNPLHNDLEYAKTTEYGRPIAHGALMVALTSRVLGMHIPGRRSLILSLKVQYPKPLYYPTKVRVVGELKQFDPERNTGTVHVVITDLSKLWTVLDADVSFGLHSLLNSAAREPVLSVNGKHLPSVASIQLHRTEKPMLLVTGGTGGIGSRLLPQLANDYGIVCLTRKNLPQQVKASLQYEKVDIEEEGVLESFLEGIQPQSFYGILHLSAPPIGRTFVSDDLHAVKQHFRQSVEVPLILAKWARKPGSTVKRFLLLGSTAGTKYPKPNMGPYSLGKAAMEHLSRLLTADLAGIGATVNILVPTLVPVGINEGMPERSRKTLAGKMPTGKLIEAKDIGDIVEFLLSDKSKQINGTTIPIDGGLAE